MPQPSSSRQDFLLGSARNVGARELERRAENLASCLRPQPDAHAAHAAPMGGACSDEVGGHVAARADEGVGGFEEVAAFWKVRGGRARTRPPALQQAQRAWGHSGHKARRAPGEARSAPGRAGTGSSRVGPDSSLCRGMGRG